MNDTPDTATATPPNRITLTCILHVEVRSRPPHHAKDRRVQTDRRVYTTTLSSTLDAPGFTDVHMLYSFDGPGWSSESTRVFHATEFDRNTLTATYRETLHASDKLVERLEKFGWVRRRDLEVVSA